MLKALAAAGITVNADMTDEELMAKYNELQANQSDAIGNGSGDDKADLAELIASAVKPLAEELASVKLQLTANKDVELDELATLIGNSDKYAGIDADSAKKLGVDTLKAMAANCTPAHGLSGHLETNTDTSVETELPE